jgi:hypothetical protein
VKGSKITQSSSILNTGVTGVDRVSETFFKHNSYTQLTQNVASGGAINQRLSQVVRKSAITKYSMDDDANQQYDSTDENTYLSKYDLIMNSNELFNGEYGLTYIKCFRCDSRLEYYNEDSLGGLITLCTTLVHRECFLAAPFILDMLIPILRIAAKKQYGWQVNSNFYLPGNYTSVAKQFLRCVLHQLINNKILFQLFQCDFESNFFLWIRIKIHKKNFKANF